MGFSPSGEYSTPKGTHGAREKSEVPAYQRSLVRVLHDREELKAARQRAIGFKRLAMTAASARVARYLETGEGAAVISISDAAMKEPRDNG
jgi:hypothetical protein